MAIVTHSAPCAKAREGRRPVRRVTSANHPRPRARNVPLDRIGEVRYTLLHKVLFINKVNWSAKEIGVVALLSLKAIGKRAEGAPPRPAYSDSPGMR